MKGLSPVCLMMCLFKAVMLKAVKSHTVHFSGGLRMGCMSMPCLVDSPPLLLPCTVIASVDCKSLFWQLTVSLSKPSDQLYWKREHHHSSWSWGYERQCHVPIKFLVYCDNHKRSAGTCFREKMNINILLIFHVIISR